MLAILNIQYHCLKLVFKISLKNKFKIVLIACLVLLSAMLVAYNQLQADAQEKILFTVVNPQKQSIALYWKDKHGARLGSIAKLKRHIENQDQTLLFAMNGGMFNRDFSPQGLYIENFKTHATLDTGSGDGNFYMKPNGIFYINNKNEAVVCQTQDFKVGNDIKFATQSGPMLLINGDIHPAFKEGSSNLNIRNGVGITAHHEVIFAMSKEEINFYDFAKFFQDMGCKQALYLDGFVSRAYLPEKDWIQNDGNFGVMIAVTKK